MTARDDILKAVHRGLTKGGADENKRRAAVADRLAARARHLTPARGQDSGPSSVDRFQAEAERVQATVARVASLDDVPRAVADYLAAHNMPAAIKMTPDPRLQVAPWGSTALKVAEGPAEDADTAGVSMAFGGVAETGTLVFTSGAETPVTVNYLPPVHIAVLRASDIAGAYEDIWARLRAERGETAFMPRTVNWITGPSRTADIELTLFLGIHGPKNLHIVVVEDGGA